MKSQKQHIHSKHFENSLSHLSCLHNFNSSIFPFYVTIFVRTHQLVVMSQVGGRSILLYNFKLQRNRPWKHFQTSGWLQLPAGYCGEKAPWIWPIGWILRVFLEDEQIKKIMKKKSCTKSIFCPVWKWWHSILFWDELFFSTKPPAETRFTHKPASSGRCYFCKIENTSNSARCVNGSGEKKVGENPGAASDCKQHENRHDVQGLRVGTCKSPTAQGYSLCSWSLQATPLKNNNGKTNHFKMWTSMSQRL